MTGTAGGRRISPAEALRIAAASATAWRTQGDERERLRALDLLEQMRNWFARLAGSDPATAAEPLHRNVVQAAMLLSVGLALEDEAGTGTAAARLEEACAAFDQALARAEAGGRETGAPPPFGTAMSVPEALAAVELALNDAAGDGDLRPDELARIDDAIGTGAAIADALPREHPLLAALLSAVGGLLQVRYERASGDARDLDGARATLVRAVARTRPDDPRLPERLNGLGELLLLRVEQQVGDGDKDLAMAVRAFGDAGQCLPEDHPARAALLHNQSRAFLLLHTRSGDADALDRAVATLEQAVDLIPETSSAAAELALRLAELMLYRIDRSTRVDLAGELDRAESLLEWAINASQGPPAPEWLARHMAASGLVHQQRFERVSGDLDDLDRACAILTAAPDRLDDGHPSKPEFLSNAGNILRMRFEHAADADRDLPRAIGLHRRAVRLGGRAHPRRASLVANLGLAWLARAEACPDDRRAVRAAVGTLRRVVALWPPGDPSLPLALGNLGVALSMQAETGTDRAADLDEAVATLRRAAALVPEQHRTRPRLLANFAQALGTRISRAAGAGGVPQADDLADMLAAMRQCTHAAGPVERHAVINAARVARLADRHGTPAQAAAAWAHALELRERLLEGTTILEARAADAAASDGVAVAAARAWLRAGDPALAVCALERGQGRLAAELAGPAARMLAQLREHPLPGVRALAHRYDAAERAFRRQRRDGGAAATAAGDHAGFADLVEEIRGIEGCEGFARPPAPPDMAELAAAAAAMPLVYLLPGAGADAGHALIVRHAGGLRGEVQAVPLPGLADEAIAAVWEELAPLRAMAVLEAGPLAALDAVYRRLWTGVAAPLLAACPGAARLRIVPAGRAALLPPLGGAWAPDPGAPGGRRYAADAVTFLHAANARGLHGEPGSGSGSGRVTARTGAAAVYDPRLPDLPDPDGAGPGGMGRPIGDVVAGVLAPLGGTARPGHAHADAAAAIGAADGRAVWLLAGHGTTRPGNPFATRIVLGSGLHLSLGDLMATPGGLAVDLVLFASCLLASVDDAMPGESLAMPAVAVAAGARGAVAAPWPVADAATMALMDHMVRAIAEGQDGAQALATAQRALRASTATAGGGTLHPSPVRAPADGRHADHHRPSFAHPCFWAGFAFHGRPVRLR